MKETDKKTQDANAVSSTDLLCFYDALKKLKSIKASGKLASIYRDRGWGDQPERIMIISQCNGQKPLGSIRKESFNRFLDQMLIGGNTYRGCKSRAIHDFIA